MSEPDADGRRVFLKTFAVTLGACALYGRDVLGTVSEGEAREGPGQAAGIRHAGRLRNRREGYAFIVDVDKCIGCGNCVEACARENEVPEGYNRTWIERYVATDEGVHIDALTKQQQGFRALPQALKAKANWAAFVPKLCNHCDEPPCVQVCPVGATFKESEGFVLIDPEHCIGCGYCVQACPFGVRFINPVKRHSDKCTWCYHRIKRGQQPACVTVCPTGARAFGKLGNPDGKIADLVKADQWRILKPEMHTSGRVFYLGLPREVV